MNKLILAGLMEPEATYIPSCSYLNLYLSKSVSGHANVSLEAARAARMRAGTGMTICISRDKHGDFTIEKIEEF